MTPPFRTEAVVLAELAMSVSVADHPRRVYLAAAVITKGPITLRSRLALATDTKAS
jgi:hypothetical protein